MNFFLSFFDLICFWLFHINGTHILFHVYFLHETFPESYILIKHFLKRTHIHLTLWIIKNFIIYIFKSIKLLFFKILLLMCFINHIHLAINFLMINIS